MDRRFEGAGARALADAKRAYNSLKFKIPAGVLLALAALAGAILPQDADLSVRAPLAVAGAVGGPLGLGMLVLLACWIIAPIRQRDEARDFVWDHSRSSGTARLVALALADSANRESRLVWRSKRTLAGQTGVSGAAVAGEAPPTPVRTARAIASTTGRAACRSRLQNVRGPPAREAGMEAVEGRVLM